MNILIISECYPTIDAPQYGIFIKQQIEEFAKLGHSYDVVIPKSTGKNGIITKIDDTDYYEVDYKTFRYDLFPDISANCFYKQLLEMIKNNKYDIVAVHITSDVILKLAVKACNKLNVPVVAHYHGLNVWTEFTTKHKHREKWYAKRRQGILKKTQALVGVSQKVTDIIRQRIPEKPLSYTVYNGVDNERFMPYNKDRTLDTINLVGVGNLIYIKGFEYLIEAFAKICSEKSSVKLHIVGDGIERGRLEQLTKTLNLNQNVNFYGKLPYDEVSKLVSQCDLFVLPSFYEALGCVYLEAMACAVPAIGVIGMGIDEIIKDGINGYLVKPCDTDDLYKKIKEVLEDREKLSEVSKQAYNIALQYSWKNSAIALEKIYQGIVN